MATPEERSELLKLGVRVDVMRSQPETNRFYYLNLHEKLHRRISECTRCPALCDAIERTRLHSELSFVRRFPITSRSPSGMRISGSVSEAGA